MSLTSTSVDLSEIKNYKTLPHCTCTSLYEYPEEQPLPLICACLLLDVQARYPHHYTAGFGPFYYLFYTTEGEGIISDGKNTIALQPDTVCFWHSNATARIKTSAAVWHYRILVLSGQQSAYFYNYFLNTGSLQIPVQHNSPFCRILASFENNGSHMLHSPLCHVACVTQLLAALSEMRLQPDTPVPVPEYIRKIKDTFDRKYSEYFSLDLLEKEFHINKFKLAKDFTQYYGTSPISYLTCRRIEAAKNLLLTTSDHVNEIGRKVGYENTNHFINSFKKQTGQTPLSFKKQHAAVL